MSEIVPVKLSLGELNTLTEGDVLWVVFRPAVEALGLNVKTQIDKVKSRSWACVSLRDMQVPGDSQVRRHLVVDRKTLTMWLATVNEHNVAEEKRPQLVTFQKEATEALDRHFHGGGALRAIGRKATYVDAEVVSFDEAMAIYLQERGGDFEAGYFTRILRAAGYLRQGGCIPRKKKRKFFFFNKSVWEIRTWALPLLFFEFEQTMRELTPRPWNQQSLFGGES